MAIALDHLILPVKDVSRSLAFYMSVLGLGDGGTDGPFTVARVTADLVILLAPWGRTGGQETGQHLAFSMQPSEFDATFARIREAKIPYGDSFHSVGNMKGPGVEDGARGPGRALYVHDPDEHLIEIRSYPPS